MQALRSGAPGPRRGRCPRLAGLGLGLGFLLAGAAGSLAGAGQLGSSAEVRALQAFLAHSAPICLRQAARHCVEAGWRFADRNRDGHLTLSELEQVRDGLDAWLAWPDNGIAAQERAGVRLGLMILDAVGLGALFDSYDADASGTLSRAELLSDVRLDERPLGRVLLDPAAVDWERIKGRLGAAAPALGGLGVDGTP